MRLINADSMLEAFKTEKGANALGHSVLNLLDIQDIIDEQPSIEIVLCKYCEHWRPKIKASKNRCMCAKIHKEGIFQHYTEPYHYCGYGKRKDKNGDNK